MNMNGKSEFNMDKPIKVVLTNENPEITLYVTETDSKGTPVSGLDTFNYVVTVNQESVFLDGSNNVDNPKSVTITNQEKAPTPTPKKSTSYSSGGGSSSKTTTSVSHSVSSSSTGAKTGDDTPIALYVGILALAALVIILLVVNKRRKDK